MPLSAFALILLGVADLTVFYPLAHGAGPLWRRSHDAAQRERKRKGIRYGALRLLGAILIAAGVIALASH